MDILLRGGRVIDTSVKDSSGAGALDAAVDILIRDGTIAEIGSGLAPPSGGRVLDVGDKLVTAGLVDLHVHFREPGQEYKEDIASGARAAAAGGFTTACCMPNTVPVNDCRTVTELITRRAREAESIHVRPIGAITRGLQGKALAEIGDMRDGGIVAVSDDGHPVMDGGLMRRALEYAHTFGLPVVQHAIDLSLAENGYMNEGEVATRIGLRGQPSQAESVMVARDIELAAWTGARYHLAHASCARSVELVREAKRRGLPVTCEVTPHHFTLTDAVCADYDPSTKVMPPLRGQNDVEALIEGMVDGTVDCIATDHAPHSDVEKQGNFDEVACGMVGLETAVPLALALVRKQVIGLVRMVELFTSGPARCFGLDREGVGSLRRGSPADICVTDVNRTWTVDRAKLQSKASNTPFHGWEVQGLPLLTLVGGKPVHDPEGLLR